MAEDTAVEPTVLDRLREQRDKERDELAGIIEARKAIRDRFDESNADDEARAAFLAAEDQYAADLERREKSLDVLKRRMKEERVLVERRESAARKAAKAAPIGELRTVEPLTYRPDNSLCGAYGHGHSYFADLAAIHNRMPNADVYAARERIDRHAAEMRVEIP
ncbi:MAG TPA: hypothetical protein VMU14_07895, partial [Acidimicrobiales bacterium]|nr:hypothetical protein [Acidimicrobiales bacterium]